MVHLVIPRVRVSRNSQAPPTAERPFRWRLREQLFSYPKRGSPRPAALWEVAAEQRGRGAAAGAPRAEHATRQAPKRPAWVSGRAVLSRVPATYVSAYSCAPPEHLQRWQNLGVTLEDHGMALGSRAPEITETLDRAWKSLGKPLENLGMDWESVWPETRARPGECLAMGNVKQVQTLEDHGMNLGEPGEDLGKPRMRALVFVTSVTEKHVSWS
eukprot:gene8756-biopygen13593